MALDIQKVTNMNTGAIIATVLAFVTLLLMMPYHLTQQSNIHGADLQAKFYVDNTFTAQLQDMLDLSEDEWQAVDSFNFGLNSQPHWLKLSIAPSPSAVALEQTRVLLINYALLDHLDVWFLSDEKSGNEVLAAYKTGDTLPYFDRIIQFEQFLFNVPAYDGELTVFLRASSKGPVKVPVELWQESEFIEHSGLHKLFIGVFFGFMIAMALSNLFIFASTQKSIFVVYTCYLTSIALVVASLQGIGFHYIWPNNMWLQEFAVPIFANLVMIFITSLTIGLLKLKVEAPVIYRLLRNIRFIFIAMLVLCLFLPYEVMIKSVLVLLILTAPIILVSGLILAIKGSIVARYFCLAWSALLVSGVCIAMENFGFFDAPIDTGYLVMVAVIVEAVLLALALAISFSEQLVDASSTRDLALNNELAALKARDELIALQDKNQADLEYSIEERTLELEIALRELSEKNTELEKLSAIDPLTSLMNRRFFDKRLLAETRRSKRELTPLGLAMLDIDHFKAINDTYGHLCGDHCLTVFAQVLKDNVKRPSDVVCRYGGEEFVLILPNTDIEGVAKLLEKIRVSVQNKKILFEGTELSMTVSIGGCSRVVASEDEHTLLLAFVDKKLYEAKEDGRNCVKLDSY
jgi:diguanylate cyclase (GGDEF)-like protein